MAVAVEAVQNSSASIEVIAFDQYDQAAAGRPIMLYATWQRGFSRVRVRIRITIIPRLHDTTACQTGCTTTTGLTTGCIV